MRTRVLPALLGAVLATSPATAQTTPIGPDDYVIGDPGPSTFSSAAAGSATAYNPVHDEYLVVWHCNQDEASQVTGYEIYGQRLDAATGAAVGPDDFRISTTGSPGLQSVHARHPDVAYNPDDDEYLVVWDAKVDAVQEIWGQRLDGATGAEIGDDFQISHVESFGPFNVAIEPEVEYSPASGEYLVVYEAQVAIDRIRGQRLAAPTATPVGDADFIVSPMDDFLAQAPSIAHEPGADLFLVVWEGNDSQISTGDREGYGQLVQPGTGAKVGPTGFRFSNMGGFGLAEGVFGPTVAADPVSGEFLAVWPGDDGDGGLHVYGQRIGTDGEQIGADDFQISTNPPGPDNPVALRARAAHVDGLDRWLVTWDEYEGTLSYEVYSVLLDGTGAAVDPAPTVLTETGAPGDVSAQATDAAVCFGGSSELLVTFTARESSFAEFEVRGQRVSAVPIPSAEVVRLGSPPNPAAFLPGVTSGPVVGATWDPVVDHTAFLPTAALDVLGISAAPVNLPLAPFGTLLVDALSSPPLSVTAAPGVPFAVPVPGSSAFVGVALSAQAASTDGATTLLANALDLTVGSL